MNKITYKTNLEVKMKHSIGLWQLLGFTITSLFGTLLHFLFEWTNLTLLAPFSGVNESTWEHMKLLFWPMLIFAIFQSFFFGDVEDFWPIKLKGILLGLVLIPILFYTYNGAIGKSPDWFNIAIFFICAAAAYVYEAWLFCYESVHFASRAAARIILFFVALSFVIFTFLTPKIEIFRDPLTGNYGIM